MTKHHRILLTLTITGLFVVSGCTSSSTSNTARTAKEQLLLSNAVDQSLNKVDFTPLYGQKVFLEEKYLECIDKAYVVGSLRHRILRAGGVLAAAADGADVVMEVRSGGVGTDTNDAFLGTPELVLPGMLTLPEVRLVERKAQFAYSKLAIVLYDAATKQSLGEGGMSMARSDDSNLSILGIGPWQKGTLRDEVARGEMIPEGTYRRQLPATVALGTRDGSPVGESSDKTRFASESKTEKQ